MQNSSIRINYECTQKEIQSVKGFKIAHLNIRSLIIKHIDEFRIFLRKKQFDIICLNETMLDETIADNEVLIDGYEITRKDRNRHGGGVLLYIRNTINYKLRNELMIESLEMVTVEVMKPKAKSFLVNAWYRPPSSKAELFDDYENVLEKIDAENVEVICIGDFNCDWSKQGMQSHTDKLKDMIELYQFEQLITEPTRVTENTSTLIDLAFTNKAEIIVRSEVHHIGISDHSLICITRKLSIPRGEPKVINTRQYKGYDKDNFIADLSQIFHIDFDHQSDDINGI
jgi:exonuclease III